MFIETISLKIFKELNSFCGFLQIKYLYSNISGLIFWKDYFFKYPNVPDKEFDLNFILKQPSFNRVNLIGDVFKKPFLKGSTSQTTFTVFILRTKMEFKFMPSLTKINDKKLIFDKNAARKYLNYKELYSTHSQSENFYKVFQYHRCILLGEMLQAQAVENLELHNKVFIEGSLRFRSFFDRYCGANRISCDILVENFKSLDKFAPEYIS